MTDKKSESRSRDSQKSESNSLEINQFSSQSTTYDSNRRESKYANNQDNRPKKTTSRFSNPSTTKIPSLLDLPSENPYANNEMPSTRSTDTFFRNDEMPTSTMKPGPNRFSQSQSNRFANEQGSQSNNFSDGMNFSKDPSFGYRFGDNNSNWNKHDQPSNRFADEQPFSNQFGSTTSGRDNFGTDSQDRFTGQNFANNANRFAQDQLSNQSAKFPSNSSQFSRFGQEQTRSNSNSQESFAFGPSTERIVDPPSNPFPKDQDDRLLTKATFPSRFVQQDAAKSFTNPFAQNAPNKLVPDDGANNFPGKDVKVETDAGRHSLNENQRFQQNQTPTNFMITTPPPNEQRNLFPNQSMNRFANTTNQDGFGQATTRFDDFPNSFSRPTFNIPPMNQPTNFIPHQPNLQQPPPNFQSNNQPSNIISPFNNSAFGMNFTTPPPANPLLHTIPQPMPMSLNKIPPPKDFDLNAIPEPQVNLGPSNFPSSTG